MGKNDTNFYRNRIEESNRRNNDLFGQVWNPNISRYNSTANRADNERSTIWKGYQDVFNNPDQENQDVTTLRGLIGGGGYRADNSGYDEFARSGGYSDKDIANVRARNLAPIRSAYQSGIEDMNRRNTIQGGYMPGFAGGMRSFMRGSGQAMSNAALNGEIGLHDTINEGRKWGIEGGQANLARAASINNQARSIDAQIANYLVGRGDNNRLAALSGMRDLYGSNSGELGSANQMLAGLLGQNNSNTGQNLSFWQELSSRPGAFDKFMQAINAGAGLAGAFMGGGEK